MSIGYRCPHFSTFVVNFTDGQPEGWTWANLNVYFAVSFGTGERVCKIQINCFLNNFITEEKVRLLPWKCILKVRMHNVVNQ